MLENILNSILHNLAPLKCRDGNLCPTILSLEAKSTKCKKCSVFSEQERGENTQTTTPNNIINYFLAESTSAHCCKDE